MDKEAILTDIDNLPENLQHEVLHFIAFLKKEYVEKSGNDGQQPRIFGRTRGKYKMAPDFDKPLEDFKDYM
ncbi:type II toxin-antitoxin system VapB family antitoxin [Dyadobacter sp. MSC1_007]|jgi:hypothetical protein|uniref:type II toxin-antitoxin system VapB family antitoxin n=1 Tax=Dyadobacter sp. MSC1_007 TaxID=2909264 RepID=UPI002030CCE0|nr:DUF2281 domain-containing protein [Dyadobacter sp. MSC1_007]